MERHLDALRIRRTGDTPPPREDALPSNPAPARVYIGAGGEDDDHGDAARGAGALAWEGGAARVAWGPAPRRDFPHVAHFTPGEARFPLVIRPWRPGDRMQMPYGRKKVKKLLLEARIPADRRNSLVVLADASGLVLWIPGVTGPHAAQTRHAGRTCCVEVSFDDEH